MGEVRKISVLSRVLLIGACLLILVVVVAPVTLLGSALFTASGLQFLVRHLPRQLGPVRLTIVGVHGTIHSGLHVERVEIDHRLVHLTFEGISARVALRPLLLQTIRAPNATVERALIEVKRRTTPSTGGPPTFLPRWLLISVEHAQVGDAVVSVYNGFRMEMTNVSGAAVIRHSTIRIFNAEGQWRDARLAASGELRATDPLGIEAHGHIDWHPPGQPVWTVAGTGSGDLNALNVVAHAVSPFRADVNGQLLDLTRHFHYVGDAQVRSFDLAAWGAAGPLGAISGHLAFMGDANQFSVHGPLTPQGMHAGVFQAEFTGGFAAHVLVAKHMEVRHLASGAHAEGSGSIAIVPGGPRLDLKGSWNDFRWPLVGRDVAVQSTAGEFTLAGTLPYHVQARGSLKPAQFQAMALDVDGTLGKDGFGFERADVDLLGGHAQVHGEVVWSPHDVWSVAGTASGINPASLRPDLPGSVGLQLAAAGRGFSARGDISVTVSNLGGRLRGVRASGGGTLTHSGSTWTFDRVRVGLGGATLALDGRIDRALDLRFALTSEDLSLLAAGSRGKLNAQGVLRGTLADPLIAASVRGKGVSYQGVTLESVDADIDFNPDAAGRESRVNARLHNLSFGGRTLQSAALTLSGPPEDYTVQLSAQTTGLTATAKARGPYSRGVFDGQLTALALGGEDVNLALEHSVGLTASVGRVRVDWLCLAGTPSAVCLDADWSPAHWSATLMSKRLPLATLTAGSSQAVQYAGTIDALMRLAGGAEQPVTGTLHAQLQDAVLSHKLVSNRIEHTKIGSGTLTLAATATEVDASAELSEGEVGTLSAKLQARRTSAAWQDMPLGGSLHAQTADLGLLSLYFPDIDRAAGHFSADVNVSGMVGAPRLGGAVKISDGELDLYQVNLRLRQVALEAQFSDGGLAFKGSGRAGSGSATVSGHLEWHKLLPYGKLQVQGANLRVADIPEAQIDASPDLDFDVEGRRIEVSGKVTIPYAKIQPRDITNAILVSPDETIIGAEQQNPAERFQVVSTVTLTLGDKVSVDASGLTGRVVGSVTVKSGYDAITRGSGELRVVDGQYFAYARKLDIKTGRLIFSGGPIDNPGIDLRAQKEFPDVTAGVNVRGTLRQPIMSFFSDPPLPQSQIVSLILAGGSLQSAQNPNNAAIGQGAALLAAQLGSRVGLPDVSLETDPILNETSLVIGRYLSPRLYVSYGTSITETLNTFKLRYTLGDHWTVKTEIGTARGADLVYSIER
ncbi:MAG: translocation/assembly module TamB domain-containing protein [Steroidobacteraceae bacterium]